MTDAITSAIAELKDKRREKEAEVDELTRAIEALEKVVDDPGETDRLVIPPDSPGPENDEASGPDPTTPTSTKPPKTSFSDPKPYWRKNVGRGRTKKRCTDNLCRGTGIALVGQVVCPDCGKRTLRPAPTG